MTVCKYPGCDHEEDSRPYARKGIPSVTEIIHFANLGSKSDSFAWAASEIAATYAIHELEQRWADDSDKCTLSHKKEPGLCKVCKLVRHEFRKRWDTKAALGNHVHHLAVNWASGEPITYDTELDPYFDDLELFYTRYKPKWLHVERTVHYNIGPREYVGTFDAIAEITCPLCFYDPSTVPMRCTWLLDIKTGSKWELEWMLQLSAYMYAKHLTRWEEGKQIGERAMPTVAHAGVLWLGSGVDDPLVHLNVTAGTHNQFLRLLDGVNWENRETKALKERDKERSKANA